jgi:hypothetical protein
LQSDAGQQATVSRRGGIPKECDPSREHGSRWRRPPEARRGRDGRRRGALHDRLRPRAAPPPAASPGATGPSPAAPALARGPAVRGPGSAPGSPAVPATAAAATAGTATAAGHERPLRRAGDFSLFLLYIFALFAPRGSCRCQGARRRRRLLKENLTIE